MTPKVKVKQNVAQYPLHHMTYVPAKFDVATSHGQGEDAFKRKYITGTVAQYRQHHVTYEHAKFEVASSMSNGLGGDAFTRKYIL